MRNPAYQWYDGPEMEIAQAIREAAASSGWPSTRLAFEAGVTDAAARRWLSGESLPSAEKLEKLRRVLPGLAQRLDEVQIS